MFVFKPTVKTYSDPVAATFTPGIPFGREKSKGDICLLHTGFTASKIYLNSHVLREAILNSKEYLEEVLQLKITDKVGKEPAKVKLDVEPEVYTPDESLKFPELPVDKDTIVEEEDLKVTENTVTVTTIDSSDLNITASPLPVSDYTVTANTDVPTTETTTEEKPKKKSTKK